MVKSLLVLGLSAFIGPHTKCFSRVTKKTRNKFHQGALLTIIFVVIITGIASKLEKNGAILSRFHPCPSLLSVSTESRKQFQWVKYSLK